VTEGNPLFVEETIRMLIDDGVLQQLRGRWTLTDDLSSIAIPPTILALLAARLDRLEPEQRTVIERAAVVGRSFWWVPCPSSRRRRSGRGLGDTCSRSCARSSSDQTARRSRRRRFFASPIS
jgi:hypothetical protein